MTANQINLWSLREQQRANRARESIQRRGNEIQEISANANLANADTRKAELELANKRLKFDKLMGAANVALGLGNALTNSTNSAARAATMFG